MTPASLKPERQRTYSYRRDVTAGCNTCTGNDYLPLWDGKNAQGVAARHFDATGHETWVVIEMHLTYKAKKP